ncbi:MAG: hypothetical protein WC968_01120 [Bacilli bacterium]
MNRRKAFINILTSTIFKVFIVLITIFARSVLMRQIGEEATGLFSLYTSILGFLSIAELGVGTAITFSMYKPIVAGDKNMVSALYFLYKKIYRIIFFVILAIGILITPLVPLLAKNQTGSYNIYFTYILFLGAQVITYLYGHKTSLINAHLDNYVTTTIHSIGLIVGAALQIFVLLKLKNFDLFFASIIIGNLIQWVLTEVIYKVKYRNLINGQKKIDDDLKKDVIVKVKALFLHRIGGLLVNTGDSIIISTIIGIGILGYYSNYITIVNGVISVLTLVFTSITNIVGHSYAKNSKEVYHKQFIEIYILNYLIAFVFFLGFFMVIDPLVTLLFTEVSILPRDVVLIISINYFVQFMRNATLTFKDASGLFYYDRFKPLVEGIANLILSLIFVFLWGIQGVLIATIITNLALTHIVEPFVLFKFGFNMKPTKYYLVNYLLVAMFIVIIFIIYFIPLPIIENPYVSLLINGTFSIIISLTVFGLFYFLSPYFRMNVKKYISFRKIR